MKISKLHISAGNKAIITILFFAIAIMYLVRWNGNSGENYRNIIRSDGYGYYDYFPMLLGEKPLNQQKANGVYLLKTPDGKVVNKYFVGTALLQSPFVLSVVAVKTISGEEIDFHSEIFQKTVSIAALFYLLIGLIALRKLLILYKIDIHIIEFSLFAVFFGTNLFYYSVMDPSMSHVYSFAMVSFFLLFAKKLSLYFTPKNLLLTAFFMALVILIRPLNILIFLFLPFITGSVSDFLKLILNKIKILPFSLLAIVIFFITLSIQLFVWKVQTGNFIVWSYANEGFYFSNPAIFEFLFSFRKGLFIYTPFVLVSLVIYLLAKRKNIQQLALSFGFLIILIYVLSSWWNWYYGDSYGSRVFIDYYPVIVLLLALGLKNSKIIAQRVSVMILSLVIVLNILQSYQYYHNILSHFDMNAEKYKYVFGRIDSEYENCLGANDDIVSFHKKPLVTIFDKEIILDDCNMLNLVVSAKIIDNKSVVFENNEYGLSAYLPVDTMFRYRETYLELQNYTKLIDGNLDQTFWTITYLDSAKNVYNYQKIKINGIPANVGKPRYDIYKIRLPKPLHNNDLVQLSIWNYSKANFELSHIIIKLSGIVE
ncbi:MAG TPA: hypothetical protein ENK66_01835 [Arcobacter sp.]|nr:hypothetical protein [Arcobacter sp.]